MNETKRRGPGRPPIENRKQIISARISVENAKELALYRNKSQTIDIALTRLFKQQKEMESMDGDQEKEDS